MMFSRVKSTQHPDNVHAPFFAQTDVMAAEDEIQEAFYVFSHLRCREQLWDAEGKEADNYVVKKLLSRYEEYFRSRRLGEHDVISLRVPNPDVERADAKILLEALYSITRSYDIARIFYGEDAPSPIGEVYVPMVRSARDVLRVKSFYDTYVIREQRLPIMPGDIAIREWLGSFGPERLRVTPLVEDKESILGSHRIAAEIIASTKPDAMRFWYARSDPALNYGSAATVLMLKVALQRLHRVEEETGVPIYPTLGLGSAPFRGNFRPDNARTILDGYPSVQTFTIQSSFKYDHPVHEVQSAVQLLNESSRGRPRQVDEEVLLPVIEKLESAYRQEVALVAPLANRMAPHVPARRKRKLHVGLFGYARKQDGLTLPRAITFTAAMYSLGLPPELLGLSALSEKDIDRLHSGWKNFATDHADAARYCNPENLRIFPQEIQDRVRKVLALLPVETDREHARITSTAASSLGKERYQHLREEIVRAAAVRRFLG